MVINTNMAAQTSATHLQTSQAHLAKSLSRLSSGSKITSPADDAAGLAVASRLDAQIQRIAAAKSNVGNAVSFTQTQDGYLTKVARAFDRMSELSLLSQDVTKTDADRALYNTEFSQLSSYVTNTAGKDFNGVSLFSASNLNVTIDSEGNTFTMAGIDLGLHHRHRLEHQHDRQCGDGVDERQVRHHAPLDRSRDHRRLPGPFELHGRPADGEQGKPHRRQLPHPGCGHGRGSHGVRPPEHSGAVRHRDARAGEPAPAERAPVAAVKNLQPSRHPFVDGQIADSFLRRAGLNPGPPVNR
jgi:hypothetical protein